MSTYLSYRRRSEPGKPERRLSEPEKPEPRFQWRLRVHTLMMDDSEKAASLSDKRSQRYDSKCDSRGSGSKMEDTVEDSSDSTRTRETHRERRERFQRTKSDSHLKLRVRFSKVLDTASMDDDDYMVDTQQEYRRLRRSSQESGLSSSDKNQVEDSSEQPARRRDHSKTPDETNQPGDNEDDTDGAVGGYDDKNDTNDTGDNVKDVSKGAIPKRYSGANSPRRGRSRDSDEEEKLQSEEQTTSSALSASSEYETIPDERKQEVCNEDGANTRELKKRSAHDVTVAEQSADELSATSAVSLENSFPTCDGKQSAAAGTAAGLHHTRAESIIKEDSRQESEDKDQIDDIETIIERIIAEEEAMLEGKKGNTGLMKPSAEHLDEEDMAKLKRDMKNIQDSIDNCRDDDDDDDDDEEEEDAEAAAENGIAISQSNAQAKQRSSSLPSYQSGGDQNIIQTVVPYSSSCPSSKIATNEAGGSKAQDDDEEEDEGDGWAYLPVILIEDVFTLLTPKERHQASQVCRQWYDLFYSPRVWETFILLERTLTKKRFNLYKGYQRELCPGKTQLCFRRVGSFFKRIVVTPITDYFNLYEFLRILAAFLQYQEDHGLSAMPLLHTFDFTFACASRGDGEIMVHGTGGQILEMIKQLLVRMSNLKHLKLNQLLIDVMEVNGLFDAVANCFGECLNSLEMLNVTKIPLALTDLARFRNLIKLTISPQHLSEEVLLLLAGLNLLQLHVLQDPYTCECEPVSYEAWKLMREMAPWLHVYLEITGITKAKLLIQPRAPVHGVFLRTPYSLLTNDLVMSLVEHYSKTLRYFVQERLPRVHGPRGFHARCDSSLLFLVRRCRALHTLVVRERISTATLILLANEGCLSTLLVRQNALIKRCDWPQCGEWTKEFYARLRKISLDYDKCTDEVCTLLRRRWRPLKDKQFMRLKIVPRCEMF